MAGSFDAKVEISTADAVRNLRNLRAEVKENAAQFRDFNKALQESKQNVVLAAQQMTKLAQARRQNSASTKEELANELNAARATAVRTTAEAKSQELLARRTNQDNQAARAQSQAELAETRRAEAAQRMARANSNAARSNKELTDGLSNTRYLMYDVGASLGVLAGATLALPTASASVAMSYQRDFAQVLRVTEDLTNGGLDLRNQLKGIATDIPLAFGDLTRITQLGAQLGIANSQLANFTETTAKFVTVTGLSEDTASQLFGRLEASFNPDQSIPDYFNKVGSSIAYVGAKTVATDPEIASMMNQIGSLGAAAGMTTDQTIGLAAGLASVRVQPELARGTLTRVFGQLNRDVTDGAPSLEAYGKLLGVTADEAATLWKSNPSQFFTGMISGLNGVYQRGGDLTGIFDTLGIKASRDVSALTKLAVGYQTLDTAMQASSKGFAEGNALDDMAKPVFDTVIAKLQKMANAWSNLGDSIGGFGLGPLGAIADALGGIANTLDTLIQHAPGLGVVISVLMGLVAVTGVLLGMKAAQAFVIAGLISFQQAAGNRGVTAAMSLSGVLKELSRTYQMLTGSARAATAATETQTAAQAGAVASTEAQAAANVAAASTFTRLAGGAKGFASSLLSLAGGPIGVAILGLTALLSNLAAVHAEADDAGKAIAEALKKGAAAGATEAANQMKGIKVSWTDKNALASGGKSMADLAEQTGIGFDKVITAVTNGKKGVADFKAEMNALAVSKGYKSLEDMSQKNPFAFAGDGATRTNMQYLMDKVEELGNANTGAAQTSDITDAALKKLGITTEDTGDDFSTSKSKVEEMDDALKALNDTVFGTLNNETALQAALQKIGEGLGNSGSYDTRSEGGRNNISALEDGLKQAQTYYSELYKSNEISAQQAAQGYAQFVDQLMGQIKATGGDPGPVVALANQTKEAFTSAVGGEPIKIPMTTDLIQAKDAGTAAATTAAQAVQSVKAWFTVNGDTSNADANLMLLGQNIAKITGLPYQVVMDALTDPASAKAEQVYKLISSITEGTYTASVDADTTAAVQNVKNFVAYARTELSHLQTQMNGDVGLADGDGSMSPEQKAQYDAIAAPVQVRTKPATTAPIIDTGKLNLAALGDGYKKVGDEAAKAAKKAKDAWEDAGDGIDEATYKAHDYANRLKTGLQSAFDKQYGLTKATDDYHSALNAITKKREEELKQVSDLTDKIKELNNERNKDLIDANKAQIEAGISAKYGEGDRMADYAQQAKTALDNAAAKQKDIDASRKQRKEVQDGIGKLDGYSDAAIANRQALRDLEQKQLDMVVAYANTGASVDQVRAKAQQLTSQFQTDVGQLGFNQTAVGNLQGSLERYIAVVDRVPYVKPTKVEADTVEATGDLNAYNSLLDQITAPRKGKVEVDIAVKNKKQFDAIFGDNGKSASLFAAQNGGEGLNGGYTGGSVAAIQGMYSGGMVPGKSPNDPRADNMLAQVDGKGLIKIRSREFIQPEESVDYYGPNFMEAIRTRSLPKFNMGGSPGGFRGGSAGSNVVGLDADTLKFLAGLKQDVKLYTENRLIAEAANAGNRELAAEGRNR